MTESDRPDRAAPHWAAALIPVGLLVAAALVPALRLPLLAVLGLGWVVGQRLLPRHAITWAATLPVAAILAWASVSEGRS